VRALNSLGVETYDSYFDRRPFRVFRYRWLSVKSPAAHEKLSIAETSRRDEFIEHLNLHNQHATTYLEMAKGLAESGIEKWTVDTNRMTITFYDKAGNEMRIEAIDKR
jgi:uncharacterized protein YbcV (DUF1398 family)